MTKKKYNSSSLRVETLAKALPYIQKYQNKIFVIKYGGASMVDASLKKDTIRDFLLLHCVGIKLIIIHGGGPEINLMSARLNLPVKFIKGYRVTDKQTMEIVEMVLAGKVQKELVNLINISGGKAVGLSGKDGRLFSVKPIKKMKKLGLIGEVKNVDSSILFTLLEKGFIPIISSVGADNKGQNYNINADEVACAVASKIKASKLILMTDKDGILKSQKDPTTIYSLLRVSEIRKLIKKGIISGGMLPKVKASISALQSGVESVTILNGNLRHSVLLEVFTDEGIGTMIIS